MVSKNGVNVNKAVNTGVNNTEEEMKMKNINNDGVNVNKAVNTGVNNIEEEMKMKNINNDGANINEERIYDEDWEFTNLDYCDIEDVKVADDLDEDNYYYGYSYLTVDDYDYYKEMDEAYGVLEDFKMNPGMLFKEGAYSSDFWQSEFKYHAKEIYETVMDRFRDDDPAVLVRWLERGLYDEYIIQLMRDEAARVMYYYAGTYNEYPKSVKETPYGNFLILEYGDIRVSRKIEGENYTEQDEMSAVVEMVYVLRGTYETDEVDGYEQKLNFMKEGLQVITLSDSRFINETDLWETIGAPNYTLPLIYVIENVISTMVENEDLDEAVLNHTDEIIKTLVNKGEFIYAVKDGELYEVEGVSSTGIKAVEVYIPYLLELEKAADELWGFTRVVNNLDLWDREKDEMMMKVLSDDDYSFVYQYCRDIWWDGGSN